MGIDVEAEYVRPLGIGGIVLGMIRPVPPAVPGIARDSLAEIEINGTGRIVALHPVVPVDNLGNRDRILRSALRIVRFVLMQPGPDDACMDGVQPRGILIADGRCPQRGYGRKLAFGGSFPKPDMGVDAHVLIGNGGPSIFRVLQPDGDGEKFFSL